jgi:hypothetical protein
MLLDIFPTTLIEKEELLDKESLEKIYNFVVINQGDVIVTPDELPALSNLKEKILEQATLLKEIYKFNNIEVSNRFSTHFFPVGESSGMETHSDDLGDTGRKFIAFFYLEADDTAGGELEIFDPRWLNAPWHNISNAHKIQPRTNKLVIFPTFLWHKVNEYRSSVSPRMAIDVVIKFS